MNFVNHETTKPSRTEEYAQIVYHGSVIEKTSGGKTEVYLIEGEKVDGFSGKNYNTALVNELNKMNDAGYEIVNVTSSASQNLPVKEVYLFKRKL